MGGLSTFESRTGKVKYSARDVYHFASDIRNFKQFIPEGNISEVVINKESCSFRVNMFGTVRITIAEKSEFYRIVFSGNAMMLNEFSLVLNIEEAGSSETDVRVNVNAELNPILKLMAEEPLKKFLETLINEMENFKGWKETI